MPEKPNPKSTYALAHSARCKLYLSANRPDRNLRMVLGHAFALDNLLVRIVEIENDSAANAFDNSKPDADEPVRSEIAERDDKVAGVGGGAGVTVGETGSLARPQGEQQPQGRRVSFGHSADFRPSQYNGGGNSSTPRRKSPPPKKVIPKGYEDEESTSSDDYDDDMDASDLARAVDPQSAVRSNAPITDVPPADPYEDAEEDEGPSLGLTRFESATAARPRSPPKKAPSPPPEDVPALEADLSDDEEPEDRPEPPSPPQFADDVLRSAMEGSEKDEELGDLYETLRGCPCCKQHGSTPKKSGMWRVKAEDGKQYAVLAEEGEENPLAHEHPPAIAVSA